MASPFIGEIRLVPFNFAPNGWNFCNGQLIPISENETLFALIGTTYGGDGQNTFALPNLQSRVVCGEGQGLVLAEQLGLENVTLLESQIPSHSHGLVAASSGSGYSPANSFPAPGSRNLYAATADSTFLKADSIGHSGGSQPHNNMQPYLVLNYIISMFGIFPSRS